MLATFFWWLIKADSRPLLILSDKVWDLRLSESFSFALHSSFCFEAVLRNDLQHIKSQLLVSIKTRELCSNWTITLLAAEARCTP